MVRILVAISLVLLLSLVSLSAGAATVHDESVDGDLSSDPFAPTALSIGVGSNLVLGTMQASGDTRDYFTFSIGADQALSSIFLRDYTDVASSSPGDTGFAGIIAGTTSFIPNGATVSNFLGTNHVVPAQVGTDILLALAGAPFGGTGFTPPLGPGDYTFLIQQTGNELTAYSLDLILVPEPGTALLLMGGLAGLAAQRRRVHEGRALS